jgi:acetylornithine/succinyldiaminopimelate/putrescine aminotransferase
VRGRGLLLGAVVDRPAADVVTACREGGLVVLTAGDDVVRLAPPLTVEAEDVVVASARLASALEHTAPQVSPHILLESCIV